MAEKRICPKCNERLNRVYTTTDRATKNYICLKCRRLFEKKTTWKEIEKHIKIS